MRASEQSGLWGSVPGPGPHFSYPLTAAQELDSLPPAWSPLLLTIFQKPAAEVFPNDTFEDLLMLPSTPRPILPAQQDEVEPTR
jgi:hypothetical protein